MDSIEQSLERNKGVRQSDPILRITAVVKEAEGCA
jgi:hypothetical protein